MVTQRAGTERATWGALWQGAGHWLTRNRLDALDGQPGVVESLRTTEQDGPDGPQHVPWRTLARRVSLRSHREARPTRSRRCGPGRPNDPGVGRLLLARRPRA